MFVKNLNLIFIAVVPKKKNLEELKDFSSNRPVEVVRGTVLVSLRKLSWLTYLAPQYAYSEGEKNLRYKLLLD